MADSEVVLEYQQQKIDAAAGRFNGNLNSMSESGWSVVSIDRVDSHFLVTYSRPKRPRGSVTDPRTPQAAPEPETLSRVSKLSQSLNYQEFSDDFKEHVSAGWELMHLATTAVPMPPMTAVYYTCVWERVRTTAAR